MKFIDELVLLIDKINLDVKNSTGGIFVSKSAGIASGINLVAEILKKQNPKHTLYINKKDGDLIKRGDVLLSIRGNYSDVLKIKDTCQYLFSYLCGVSSSILKYQNEIKDLKCKLLFKETILPGIGDYYNQAILNTKSEIILQKTLYFDADVWKLNTNIQEILEPHNDDQIYVEVNNLEEFQQLTISKCTHIVCVDFSFDDLEYVVENKNNKIIVVKTNMTYASIRAYASKKVDYVIINNFSSQMKLFDVEFKYFSN